MSRQDKKKSLEIEKNRKEKLNVWKIMELTKQNDLLRYGRNTSMVINHNNTQEVS